MRHEILGLKDALNVNDELGGRIDTFMIPLASALGRLGFTTSFSCHGHEIRDESWGVEDHPFILFDIKNLKEIKALELLAEFVNLHVSDNSQVNLTYNNTVQMAQLDFSTDGKSLESSRLDAIRFATFCDVISLGREQARQFSEICRKELLVDGKIDKIGKVIYEIHHEFDRMFDVLSLTLNHKPTFDLINEGMGL